MIISAVVGLVGLVGIPQVARAERISVGLYAPAEPFDGTAARLDFATRLAAHVVASGAAPDGADGRVFARGGDFLAAIKKGELRLAVVDAAVLTGLTGYTVIGAARRAGDQHHAWHLVAGLRGATSVAGLAGKRLLVPAQAGRERDFVLDVLLRGDLGRTYFGAIETAPDTASALAAVGLGKSDAALVPAGTVIPGELHDVIDLPATPGALFVVFGAVAAEQRSRLETVARAFRSTGPVIDGFGAATGDEVRELAARFVVKPRRAPMLIPAARLVIGGLLAGRAFQILREDGARFVLPMPPLRK